ncbi:MAG: hypothetical protein U1F36_11565 [Planctomycetota bacterium]
MDAADLWATVRNRGRPRAMAHGDEDPILSRLDRIEARIGALESAIAALGREAELRAQLEVKRQELEALGQQGLFVVEQLDVARRRIRELEGGS